MKISARPRAIADFLSALTLLVRHDRIEEAVVRATKSGATAAKRQVLRAVVEDNEKELARAVALVTREVLDAMDADAVEALVVAASRHAPELAPLVLERLPERAEVVAPLVAAAQRIDDELVALAVYLRVLDLPAPLRAAERAAYVEALGKACVLAHALGEHAVEAELADRSQAWGKACA